MDHDEWDGICERMRLRAVVDEKKRWGDEKCELAWSLTELNSLSEK
jgi:hypothetical protein